MNMAEHDDSDIARVLRASGGRASPSDEMTRAVYEAVHAEWQATVERQRGKRTRGVWLALAASVAVAAIALFVGRSFLGDASGELMADVSKSIGVVQVREDDSGAWQSAAAAKGLHVGDSIQTGADGRVALSLRDGVSLRLDHDTRVALISADRVNVTSGAVYIDSGATSAGDLEVDTPAGVVRHIGTQYEARILSSGTRIRVREGRVDVVPEKGPVRTLKVGDQILVSRNGVEERGRIEPSSDEWDWASNAAPEFDIDGKPVEAFLAWAGRETGLKVVFSTAESAAEARRAVLSGSIAGLNPDDALTAVLKTTSLKGTERDGQLVIEMAAR
jgi:ferric-dicitrate binding protein FerR (iron transport regulator)